MSESYEMKYSGSEWLGLVPVSWKIGNIGSLYSLRNTKVSDRDYPPLSVTMKGIVPQLETAAKTDDHDSRKLVKKGDFAINSRSDRRGSCGISEYDGSVSLINTVLTPRGNMIPRYYNWLFHTVQFADEFYKNGHGIVDDLWTTRWDEMKRILIPVPSESEQTSIASYLDMKVETIDAIIAEARASIDEYKQWKASIIYEAVTKGLDPEAKMVDSGVEWIGKMPKGWKCTALKNLCSMQSGRNITSEQIADEGDYPVYGGNGIRGYYSEWNTEGEFLTVGRQGALCGNVHKVSGRVWATEHAVVTRSKEGVSLPYLYYNLVAMNLNQYASNTAAQPGLAVGAILTKQTIIPPVEEQQLIGKYLDKKCSAIDALFEEKELLISDLEAYKKSLIFEVVTGKRKVV